MSTSDTVLLALAGLSIAVSVFGLGVVCGYAIAGGFRRE